MKNERMKIRLSSAWDKSIVIRSYGIRSYGSEVTEVGAPTPELPWEMDGIKSITQSLANIHMVTRTHETGFLSQIVTSLVAPPMPVMRRRVPVETYE
ncbi:MAG: hypothetical protein ACPLY9_01490 [Nitrososphaerales archaeon]